MKRAYEIKVEKGSRMYECEYVVVAATDEEAVRKAKRMAKQDTGVKSGWRCTSLQERRQPVLT